MLRLLQRKRKTKEFVHSSNVDDDDNQPAAAAAAEDVIATTSAAAAAVVVASSSSTASMSMVALAAAAAAADISTTTTTTTKRRRQMEYDDDETFYYSDQLIYACEMAENSKKEVFHNTSFRWNWILKTMAFCLTANAHRMVTNDLFLDKFDEILQCFPPHQSMPDDVDTAYYCVLNSLHDVSFPVPKTVNRALRLGFEQSKTIVGYYNNCVISQDDNSKLSFFLKNANECKQTLNGYRLSYLILSKFYRMDCPKALLELLQYVSCEMLERRVCFQGDGCCLMDLIDVCLTTIWYFKGMGEEVLSVVECFQYLMSTINVLSIEKLYNNSDYYGDSFNMDISMKVSSLEVYKNNIISTLKLIKLPDLEARFGLTVSSLKHICRMEIRSTLYDNWSLPHGIKYLKIPVSLQEYLNVS